MSILLLRKIRIFTAGNEFEEDLEILEEAALQVFCGFLSIATYLSTKWHWNFLTATEENHL